MTLKEKILHDLAAHPNAGTPKAYFAIYEKYRVACTYAHFSNYLLCEGIKLPKTVSTLEAQSKQKGEVGTAVEIGLRFAEQQGKFGAGELRDYLLRNYERSGASSRKHTLKVLVAAGKIEPMKRGKYRLVA